MVIGLAGKKGSGKDTLANAMVDECGFTKVSFAGLLKESAAALFDIDPAAWETYKNDPDVRIQLIEGNRDSAVSDLVISDYSAREFLQRYGTEAHRDVFGQDFWVDQFWKSVAGVLLRDEDIVVPDVRFDNEAIAISCGGGVVWEIVRDSDDEDDHPSEQGINHFFVDGTLMNDGTLEDLVGSAPSIVEISRKHIEEL